MQKGRIVELLPRDFGFIRRTGIKEHLYFHADDLHGVLFAELRAGDTVEFAITESLKGPYATQVSKHASK